MTYPRNYSNYPRAEEFEMLSKVFREGHKDIVEFKTTLYEAEQIRRQFNSWRSAVQKESERQPLRDRQVEAIWLGVAGITTRIFPSRNQSIRKDDVEAFRTEAEKEVTLTFLPISLQHLGGLKITLEQALKTSRFASLDVASGERILSDDPTERLTEAELDAEIKEWTIDAWMGGVKNPSGGE